jgi:hypothetical protein
MNSRVVVPFVIDHKAKMAALISGLSAALL